MWTKKAIMNISNSAFLGLWIQIKGKNMAAMYQVMMHLLLILKMFLFGGCQAVKIASLSSSLGNEHPYNPCKFNPTCLCSTGGKPLIIGIYEIMIICILYFHCNNIHLWKWPSSIICTFHITSSCWIWIRSMWWGTNGWYTNRATRFQSF